MSTYFAHFLEKNRLKSFELLGFFYIWTGKFPSWILIHMGCCWENPATGSLGDVS